METLFTLLSVLGGLALSALVGAVIGQSRGRVADAAMLGFVLGPIGWLIAFFLSDSRPKCPFCGGEIVAGALKCKNCGSDLTQPPPPPKVELKRVAGGVSIDGVVYVQLAGQKEEAFCFVCRRVSPMNGMYCNRERELYCHPDCLSHFAAREQ